MPWKRRLSAKLLATCYSFRARLGKQPSRHRTQLTSLHSKHLPTHIVQNQILRTADAACSSIFARCIDSIQSSVWKIRRRLGQEGELTDFEPLLPIPANDFLTPKRS